MNLLFFLLVSCTVSSNFIYVHCLPEPRIEYVNDTVILIIGDTSYIRKRTVSISGNLLSKRHSKDKISIFKNNFSRQKRKSQKRLITFGNFKHTEYNSYQYGFPSAGHKSSFESGDSSTFLQKIIRDCNEIKNNGCGWTHYLKHLKNTNLQKLSLTYIWNVCELKKGQDNICPKPCKRDPCRDKAHTVTDKCYQTEWGMFKDDYRCSCERNYIWDASQTSCRRVNVCKSKGLNPCNHENTELCSVTAEETFFCQCKEQYMGNKCTEKRDACAANYNSEKPNGVKACGANGICKGLLGSNVYSCTCNKGYTDDSRNDWPDCSVQQAKCKSMVCLNGYCMASQSQDTAQCVCDEGFGGDNCADELPLWNAWRPWATCEPTCGNPRNRKRTRTCSVIGGPVACKGNNEDFQSCAPSICKVDGEWESWSDWSDCSADCDGGKQVHTRQCYYDTQYGEMGWGKPCRGQASGKQNCNEQPCDAGMNPTVLDSKIEHLEQLAEKLANTNSDGWKTWGDWSHCSTGCGDGEKRRLRECGLGLGACNGMPFEVVLCTGQCDDGKYPWSDWSSWSPCTPGVTHCSRERSCTNKDVGCTGKPKQDADCVENLCDGSDSVSLVRMMDHLGPAKAAAFALTGQSISGVQDGLFTQALVAEEIYEHMQKNSRKINSKNAKASAQPESGVQGWQIGAAVVVLLLGVAMLVFRKNITEKFFSKKTETLDKIELQHQQIGLLDNEQPE